jgi:hypothetical protein
MDVSLHSKSSDAPLGSAIAGPSGLDASYDGKTTKFSDIDLERLRFNPFRSESLFGISLLEC